jgi:hypothetical protein
MVNEGHVMLALLVHSISSTQAEFMDSDPSWMSELLSCSDERYAHARDRVNRYHAHASPHRVPCLPVRA